MKRLLPYELALKERMKDPTISYVDLFCLDPILGRSNEDWVPQVFRRLALQKLK